MSPFAAKIITNWTDKYACIKQSLNLLFVHTEYSGAFCVSFTVRGLCTRMWTWALPCSLSSHCLPSYCWSYLSPLHSPLTCSLPPRPYSRSFCPHLSSLIAPLAPLSLLYHLTISLWQSKDIFSALLQCEHSLTVTPTCPRTTRPSHICVHLGNDTSYLHSHHYLPTFLHLHSTPCNMDVRTVMTL